MLGADKFKLSNYDMPFKKALSHLPNAFSTETWASAVSVCVGTLFRDGFDNSTKISRSLSLSTWKI